MTCHLLLNLSLEFGRSRSVCITERKNAASTEQIIMVRQTFTQVRQPLTFLKTLYEVGYLSWTWTFLLNTICEFERGWRHSFSMIPNAKKLRLHKTRFFGKSKASCRFTYIYVVILYAITGIFCMWTAILLLRTHIFSFIHRRILAHFRTSIPLTVCNSISNRSVLVVVNFVFSPLSVWFIRACCAIPWNEIPRNGTLELVLLFRIIFRTLIITGTVLRNVLEHEKLFLSHLSSAPIFIWFSLLLKCFYFLLLRLIAESFSTF